MSRLRASLNRWRLERSWKLLAEGGLRWASWNLPAWTVLLALDALWPMAREPRLVLWLFLAGVAAATLWVFWLAPLKLIGSRSLIRSVGDRRPELKPYLEPAWELSQGRTVPHTSEGLRAAHLDRVESLLESLDPAPVFEGAPSRRTGRGFLLAAAFTGAGLPWAWDPSSSFERILTPWRESPLEHHAEILPGSARVPWGAEVTLRFKPSSAPNTPPFREIRPALRLRTPQGGWRESPWDTAEPMGKLEARSPAGGGAAERGEWLYRIPALVEVVEYQMRWRGLASRTYSLTPVAYPHLERVVVRVRPPAYAGRPLQELQGAGALTALSGSWVEIVGQPSQPLERAHLALELGRTGARFLPLEKSSSGERRVLFQIQESGHYSFELEGEEGVKDPRPARYPIQVLEDEPPQVDLLSPAFDVEADSKDPLPVTYEAQDDLGLSRVDLLYKTLTAGGGPEGTVRLKSFGREPAPDFLGDAAFDLSGFPKDSKVEFRLRALDHRTPVPQEGFSQARVVRVRDFGSLHAEGLRQWLDTEEALKRFLDRQDRLLQDLDKLSKLDPASPEWTSLKGLAEEAAREAQRAWEEARRSFSEMVRRLEADPYANPGLVEEFRALEERMSRLDREAASRGRGEMQAGRYDRAASHHRRLEREVAGMLDSLSRAKKLQALQDFWGEAGRMNQEASEIREAASRFSKGKPPSEEELKALNAALSRLEDRIRNLAETLKSIPKPPEGSPEDAARRKYVVPLGEAQSLLQELQRALARGDWSRAAQLAEQLSEALGRAEAALREAAQSEAQGSGQDTLSRELERLEGLWRQAIEEESRLVGDLQKLEQERLEGRLAEQRQFLKKLALRQKRIVEEASQRGVHRPEPLEWMEGALRELEEASLKRAPELLQRSIDRLSLSGRPGQPSPFEDLAQKEREVLDELRSHKAEPPPSSLSEDQRRAYQSASTTQSGTRAKIQELSKGMGELGASLGPQASSASSALEEAEEAAGRAEQALGKPDPTEGLSNASRALERLEQGLQDLSEAAAARRRMEMAMGAPFRQGVGRVRPSSPAGKAGANTGFVRLPRAKDYQPPQDIRSEVEASLQERRSKAYERILKDYFRRLSQ